MPGRRVAIVTGLVGSEASTLPPDVGLLQELFHDPAAGAFDVVACVRPEALLHAVDAHCLGTSEADDLQLIYCMGPDLPKAGDRIGLRPGPAGAGLAAASPLDLEALGVLLDRSWARAVVVVLDGLGGPSEQSGEVPPPTPGPSEPLRWTHRGALITVSSSEAMSLSLDGQPYSVFTALIAQGIAGGYADFDHDGLIRVRDAYDYAAGTLTALGGVTQVAWGPEAQGDAILAQAGIERVAPEPGSAPDPTAHPAQVEALCQVVDAVERGEVTSAFVGLAGYFVDGTPYPATGFTVDPSAAPNLRYTHEGLECEAFFPPERLSPTTIARRGVIQRTQDGQTLRLVAVRLRIRPADVWTVVVTHAGGQTSLFCDPEVVMARGPVFHRDVDRI